MSEQGTRVECQRCGRVETDPDVTSRIDALLEISPVESDTSPSS